MPEISTTNTTYSIQWYQKGFLNTPRWIEYDSTTNLEDAKLLLQRGQPAEMSLYEEKFKFSRSRAPRRIVSYQQAELKTEPIVVAEIHPPLFERFANKILWLFAAIAVFLTAAHLLGQI